jgi:hypothetical protein
LAGAALPDAVVATPADAPAAAVVPEPVVVGPAPLEALLPQAAPSARSVVAAPRTPTRERSLIIFPLAKPEWAASNDPTVVFNSGCY